MLGEVITKPALISSDLSTEWKTFRRYITLQPKEDMKAQLKESTTNDMLITMLPNLNVLADVCLTIPVGTASVERSFSHIKNDKNTTKKSPKGEQFIFL